MLCVSPPEFVERGSAIAKALGASEPVFKSDYVIPVMVNSFFWLFMVVFSGLVGFYLVCTKLHPAIKFLIVYLFTTSFFSAVPAFSFNAYMLIVGTVLFFMILRECEFKYIINMACAVFWLEMFLAVMRMTGHDTLMNMGRDDKVFFGTIVQHMRFASLLCILSPFLLIKSKWYIIPISVAVALCASSGFSLAILAGVIVYIALKKPSKTIVFGALAVVLPLLGLGLWLGRDSFAVAIREGRFPVWMVILKSWMFDTRVVNGAPDWLGVSQSGPFDLKTFLFGHGLDSFYFIFSIYKHDPNPFAQAHNCILQIFWELGWIGASALAVYAVWLITRLYSLKMHEHLAGLAIIGVNMFPHFPTRMTQTIWLIVAYLAMCEAAILMKASRWRAYA